MQTVLAFGYKWKQDETRAKRVSTKQPVFTTHPFSQHPESKPPIPKWEFCRMTQPPVTKAALFFSSDLGPSETNRLFAETCLDQMIDHVILISPTTIRTNFLLLCPKVWLQKMMETQKEMQAQCLWQPFLDLHPWKPSRLVQGGFTELSAHQIPHSLYI